MENNGISLFTAQGVFHPGYFFIYVRARSVEENGRLWYTFVYNLKK
jgi:hypothetical protein